MICLTKREKYPVLLNIKPKKWVVLKKPFKISQINFGTDLDEMNSFMALSEVLGHLFYLENQGTVQRFEKSGNFYYKS